MTGVVYLKTRVRASGSKGTKPISMDKLNFPGENAFDFSTGCPCSRSRMGVYSQATVEERERPGV